MNSQSDMNSDFRAMRIKMIETPLAKTIHNSAIWCLFRRLVYQDVFSRSELLEVAGCEAKMLRVIGDMERLIEMLEIGAPEFRSALEEKLELARQKYAESLIELHQRMYAIVMQHDLRGAKL